MQPNYNAGFGFDILNPSNGSITPERLQNALRSNMKIKLVEKGIVEDIIERLAYVNENEIVLSDMAFFEPIRGDPAYSTYRKNFSREQDEDDLSWLSLYKEFWKALISTVKQRRIIQNEMNEKYVDAVDYMFEEEGLHKTDKFSEEDLDHFLSQQLRKSHDPELITCILESLDRDQDGLVSFAEF